MGVTIKKNGGAGSVVTHPSGTEVTEDIIIPVADKLEDPSAIVSVKFGYTKNLGNYENLRFDVFCSLPCNSNDEALDAAFTRAKDWCDGKMISLLDDDE